MRDEEIISRLFALRAELMRQMAQFERDKVTASRTLRWTTRPRAALQGKMTRMEGSMVALMQDVDELGATVAQLQSDLSVLQGRVTLCEGRITRLEAKP